MTGQQLGLQLKERALDRFEGEGWLKRARAVACALLVDTDQSIIVDDVREWVGPPPRPNMAGGLFRPACFQFVGYTRSPRPEGHANLIGMWVLA